MTSVSAGLTAVHLRIEDACRRAARSPSTVRVVGVSKGVPVAILRQAVDQGLLEVGESYLGEASAKQEALGEHARRVTWHYIGPLQSNKTAGIAERFDWVHAIDRPRIAQRLSAQRDAAAPALCVCVQVNISAETTKSGCAPPEAAALCEAIARLPRLRLRGLMAIPAPSDAPAGARPGFAALARLHRGIRASGCVDYGDFDTLSMGMSGDFEVAIEEGSTLVRVGTAIFGERPAR